MSYNIKVMLFLVDTNSLSVSKRSRITSALAEISLVVLK